MDLGSADRPATCSVARIAPESQAAEPIATAARYAAAGRDRAGVRAARDELLAAVADRTGDPRIRIAALGALVRSGNRADARAAWARAATDPERAVRRRAAELAPRIGTPATTSVLALLDDADPLVVEAACWASGEIDWGAPARARIVHAVVAAAGHTDPLVREAAVAGLGALGDPGGLPAVLTACGDRPPIRRRAVLALAAFEGPDVEAALAAALTDPDWQTRQAAQDLAIRSPD